MEDFKKNGFTEYPHYVYCSAMLIDGKLADYMITNQKMNWNTKGFNVAGCKNEIIKFHKDWKLDCEYKEILVNDLKEHNQAFDKLERWLRDNFKKHDIANWHFLIENKR